MSDDIKKLVERLDEHWGRRRLGDMSNLFADAADALERLVAERDRLKAEVERLRNEKVAGQDTAKPEAIERSTPATDPAPAVCEWTRTPWGPSPSSPLDALYIPRCNADYLCSVPDSGICRRCGLPIKFKEDKE